MSVQKVAVVTGSNKGIGFAIVRALCKRFDGVVYLTARDQKRGEDAVKQLEAEGLKPKFHQADITDQQSLKVLKDDMVKEYGGVDVFVHNAAMAYKSADTTPFSEQATVTIAINFEATKTVCDTFLPIMKPDGRFVMLSSMASSMALQKCSPENQAFFKSPDLTEEKLTEKMNEFVKAAQTDDHGKAGFPNSAYGMSKVGVTAYTRILGKRVKEMGLKNVLVNCCCPGWVRTDMAGPKAPLSPDEGAENPMILAMIPKGSSEPNGEFMQKKEITKWYN